MAIFIYSQSFCQKSVERKSSKNRAHNIECSFGCAAHSAVLLKPNFANILLFNFCEQKFVQHGPIKIAIDYNGLSLLIFEEKWANYASGPKYAPNSDLFWVHRLFTVCVRVFCSPNETILLVYIPAKFKMSFSSQLRGEQTTSAMRLIMRSSKTGRKTSSVASVEWHVAPSFWNQMLPKSSSLFFVNKTSFIMVR